mmetsp:Transcript_17455/g.52743  ORF Transcript_17455/g.52743 Transcript_17455/m.52743 type:complete len:277 (+) Transcript_17455:110-940(+)
MDAMLCGLDPPGDAEQQRRYARGQPEEAEHGPCVAGGLAKAVRAVLRPTLQLGGVADRAVVADLAGRGRTEACKELPANQTHRDVHREEQHVAHRHEGALVPVRRDGHGVGVEAGAVEEVAGSQHHDEEHRGCERGAQRRHREGRESREREACHEHPVVDHPAAPARHRQDQQDVQHGVDRVDAALRNVPAEGAHHVLRKEAAVQVPDHEVRGQAEHAEGGKAGEAEGAYVRKGIPHGSLADGEHASPLSQRLHLIRFVQASEKDGTDEQTSPAHA